MEDKRSGDVGCGDSKDVSDVLQNAQAVGHIFPEKSSGEVELNELLTRGNLREVLAFHRNHRERNTRVADVGVEYSFEASFVRNLALVHRADAVFNWHNLRKVQLRESSEELFLHGLDLLVEDVDFVSTCLV